MKPVIYQLLPRLFSNTCETCVPNGDIEQNGVGKLNDITPRVLKSIKDLGVTHVWYTGVIEHAHATDYSQYGIVRDNPYVVKGKAGSGSGSGSGSGMGSGAGRGSGPLAGSLQG